jgi:hypothetical protein
VFGRIDVLHLLRGQRVTLGQVCLGLVIMSSVLVGGDRLLNLVEVAGGEVDPDRALELSTTAQRAGGRLWPT